ncbi:MAG TPA: chemotaxis response regulator protein-glutamate methylesterase [Firmicutes bacterium]|nr:chemotaxis response regulator protein-glutamate methylesterase [Bacillota bacterium]
MIRVLVVDDSALMRRIISDIINDNPDLMVVDTAKNGKEAIEMIKKYKPDIVTMDIEMPIMDGLTALKKIMSEEPTRVIILSAFAKKDAAATITALENGAIDFVQKPSGTISLDLSEIQETLINKIIEASKVKLEKVQEDVVKQKRKFQLKIPLSGDLKGVVIGSSTGGPRALERIIPFIPKGLNAVYFVVQHMPAGFTTSFAQRLNEISQVQVKEGLDNEEVKKDVVYLAPGNYHMKANLRNNGLITISLNQDPPVWGVRPSVDVTMDSLSRIFTNNLMGIVLTGMGHDGTQGCKMIKEYSGQVIVQDKETSLIFGMPKSVIDSGSADQIIPLNNIIDNVINFIVE